MKIVKIIILIQLIILMRLIKISSWLDFNGIEEAEAIEAIELIKLIELINEDEFIIKVNEYQTNVKLSNQINYNLFHSWNFITNKNFYICVNYYNWINDICNLFQLQMIIFAVRNNNIYHFLFIHLI